jgi:hypothetical protein
MNPFNTPKADTYLELIAALIKAGAKNPDQFLKLYPKYLKQSAEMACLLHKQKVSATH